MTRIVSDTNGDYDLSQVVAITKVPRETRTGNEVTRQPPTAKLWFEGTGGVQTLLDHAQTRAAWLEVKASEAHPADRDPGDRGIPS